MTSWTLIGSFDGSEARKQAGLASKAVRSPLNPRVISGLITVVGRTGLCASVVDPPFGSASAKADPTNPLPVVVLLLAAH